MAKSLRCPAHPNGELIEDHRAGDMVCTSCGTVIGDRIIDVGTEWRTFSDERSGVDPSRVGAPSNPSFGEDLSTTFSLGSASSEQAKGLLNAQRRGVSNVDRHLNQAIAVIREMSEKINIPRGIQDRAIKVFKDVLETKCLKGKNNEAQSAACLYIACRQEGVPRTFKEICAASKVSKKEIGRCFRLISVTMENSLTLITSADYMSRFCANLGLPFTVQTAATRVAKKAVELDIVAGRSPISIAGAAIYMASQASTEKRNAKEIGQIAGVAETTIKQTYKFMLPRVAELFPDDFKFAIPIDSLPAS